MQYYDYYATYIGMYADVEMCILVEGSMQQNSGFADKITLKNSKSKSYAYEWITKQVCAQYKKLKVQLAKGRFQY